MANHAAWASADQEAKGPTPKRTELAGKRAIRDAHRKSLVEFIEESFSKRRMLSFEDILAFVNDTLDVRIKKNTLAKTLRELPVKVAMAIPQESSRIFINVGLVDEYFTRLKSLDGVPAAPHRQLGRVGSTRLVRQTEAALLRPSQE